METEVSYGSDYHFIPMTSIRNGVGNEVMPDLFGLTNHIVNVYFIGNPDRGDWLLVDAGLPKSAEAIISAAEQRFGNGNPPKAIVLTHGHFDHVGSILELMEYWDMPVYAHPLEFPYLTGERAYLPPDPTVNGGLIAKMSFWFPNEPIRLGNRLNPLPSDGSIPFFPEWKWIHTPGHTEGHVSLFQEKSRALIAGDAFVTVKQESVYQVFTQELEISGPPKYFTTDWPAAKKSVIELEALKPMIAVTGHGMPMSGEMLETNLNKLVADFDRIAVPTEGKYVQRA